MSKEASKPYCSTCNNELNFKQRLQLLTIKNQIACKACDNKFTSGFTFSSDKSLTALINTLFPSFLIFFTIILMGTFGFIGGMVIGLGIVVVITLIFAYIMPIKVDSITTKN